MIAEYDTADGWHVVKYANGRAEAMKEVSVTINISLPSAQIFWGSSIVALPDIFVQPPQPNVVCLCNYWVSTSVRGISTSSIDIYAIAEAERKNIPVTFSIRLSGKWK